MGYLAQPPQSSYTAGPKTLDHATQLRSESLASSSSSPAMPWRSNLDGWWAHPVKVYPVAVIVSFPNTSASTSPRYRTPQADHYLRWKTLARASSFRFRYSVDQGRYRYPGSAKPIAGPITPAFSPCRPLPSPSRH